MAVQANEKVGWPAENIRLLLKACISDSGARQAWDEWLKLRNIDDVNWAELRLLATLAGRINDIDPGSKEKPRLEGIRRFVWTRNQIRLDRSIQVIDLLLRANIPVMLLKGMARIATNPALASARFVRDIDVLVHSENLYQACDILINNGWRPVNGILPGKSRAEPFSRILPADAEDNPENDIFHVDIHRSVIHYGRSGTFDDAFWERCHEGQIRGLTIKVPSETDQFLHAILHATISDPERPVDWVIDAMDAAKKLDWQLLEQEIDRRRAGAAVANTLEYLSLDLGLEIPTDIMRVINRDKRNLLYNLEVNVYWRLPENRIRNGGIYRKLAEWTRSRHCLYKPGHNRKTLWRAKLLGNNKKALTPRSGINAAILDFELECSVYENDNFIIDIETTVGIKNDIQIDLLLNNAWFGRLLIEQSKTVKSSCPGIWRFNVPFNYRHAGNNSNTRLCLLFLDFQGRVLSKVPEGLKIAVSAGHNQLVAISASGNAEVYNESVINLQI